MSQKVRTTPVFLAGLLMLTAIYLLVLDYVTWPRWIATGFDPTYAYLFNAFDWYTGHGVFLWGHPGALLHWSGSAVIGFLDISGIHKAENITASLDYYLQVLSLFHIGLFLASLWAGNVLLLKFYEPTERLIFIVVCCATINTNELLYNAPETYLTIIAPFFTALLLVQLRAPELPLRRLLLLAVCGGMLLATKYTSIFLVAGLAVVIPPRKWWKPLFAVLVAFLLLMFPVWTNLGQSFAWLVDILSQSGFGYGVQQPVPSKTALQYVDFSFKMLMFDKPWLLMTSGLVGLSIYQKSTFRKMIKTPAFLGFLILLIVAFSASIYKEVFRYFVPAKYLVLPLFFAVESDAKKRASLNLTKVNTGFIILFLLSLCYMTVNQYQQLERHKGVTEFSRRIDSQLQENPDWAIIRQFNSSSETFAIFWGSFYANENYIRSANSYYLMNCTGKLWADFTRWSLYDLHEQEVDVLDIFEKKYKRILLIGSRTAAKTPYWSDNKKLLFTPLETHADEVLYEITLRPEFGGSAE